MGSMDTHDAGSDASDASALFSLLYVSEMSAPDAHEVRRICEQSRANNLRDHITGLLVFDGHAFCQFVEGRERVIAALLARLEGDPRHRHMRLLQFGPLAGDQIVVSKGLKAGEQIVTSANFLIDSEAQLQAAAGAFAPPPPGAGQAASMNALPQANVELATDPTPPHRGGNMVRVKLTTQDGKPIAGADVTVTFYMAAMPAMGMAAMRTTLKASDQGEGMYQGQGDLGSGGTWEVTIRAQQNGQVIANKQMSVNATGGTP